MSLSYFMLVLFYRRYDGPRMGKFYTTTVRLGKCEAKTHHKRGMLGDDTGPTENDRVC